jgi:hypothetical protein
MIVVNLNNKNEMIDTGLIGKYEQKIEETKGKSTRAPLRIGAYTQVVRKSYQYLLYICHTLCYC